MVIDKLKNHDRYTAMNERIAAAFDYLAQTDLQAMNTGIYELDGKNLYLMIQEYQTRSLEKALWETHQKYMDIQYIISGTEKMGWSSGEGLQIVIPYSPEKDAEMSQGNGFFYVLKQGDFIMFYPGEAHMPQLVHGDPGTVKKAVFKVLMK